MSSVLSWEVYDVFSGYTNPPKIKWVVVLAVHGTSVFGAYINSRIPRFAVGRPALHAHHIQLAAVDHPYLRYDSWLDLSQVDEFHMEEVVDFRGVVDASRRQHVRTVIESSALIRPFHRNLILAQAG